MHKLTGKMVAVKSINKEYLTDETSKKKVMQEFSILKQMRHASIIRLYETFESNKHILFVIELCGGGDLLTYVRKRRKLTEDVAKSVFLRLVDGLNYCHAKSILHRDIKLDNILLNAVGHMKICDFGVSKIVQKGERMTEQCGTPAYIAPEIIRDRGYEGFAADVWSAGVVLFAMLYGTVPFKANNMRDLQKSIMRGNRSR
jgi:serine/threonine protein kinase